MKKIISFTILMLIVSTQFSYSQRDVLTNIADRTKAADSIVDVSQTDGIWRFGGIFQLSFNQFYATNWVGTGDPFLGVTTLDRIFLTYKKNRFAWQTTLDIDFGMRYSWNTDTGRIDKTSDRVELNSQLGYRAGGNWYYTMLLNVNTQLARGYTNGLLTSTFMTPGYTTLSIGMEYRRTKWSWYISPLAGRLTFKLGKDFFNQSIAGVDSGRIVLPSVGAFTRIAFNADLHPKVNLNTKLELFYDYLGEYKQLRNLSPNFEMIWKFAITNWLSVSFKAALFYDYTIKFPVFRDGVLQDFQTDHVQFQESFGVVLGYRFAVPKNK